MPKRAVVGTLRIFFALLVATAIAAQAVSLRRHGAFNPANFFSYFTVQANILAALVFLAESWRLLARASRPSAIHDIIRSAVTLYMVVTGVVYITLLSRYEVSLSLAWVNDTLHYVMPLAVALDWLYQPPRKMRARAAWLWLLYPAAYLIYTLVRGPFVHWYPYPFTNPAQAGGYGGVALYSAGILILLASLSWLMVGLASRLRRHGG